MGVGRLLASKCSPFSNTGPGGDPGKGLQCPWGQFSRHASPYARPSTKCITNLNSIKILFTISQSEFPKNFIQNLFRILLILFSQIFLEFFFLEIFPEILTHYWGKILRKLEKNYEISQKSIERLRKFLGNLTLTLRKVWRKCVEFQNWFRECLKT